MDVLISEHISFFSFDKAVDELLPLEYEKQVYKECVKNGKLLIRLVSCDFRKSMAGKCDERITARHMKIMSNSFPAFMTSGFRTCKYLWNTAIHPVLSVYIDSTFAKEGTSDFEYILYHELGHLMNGEFDDEILRMRAVAEKWNNAFTTKERDRIFCEYMESRKNKKDAGDGFSRNGKQNTENEIKADEYAYRHSGKVFEFERLFEASRGFIKETQNRDAWYPSEKARIEAQKRRRRREA